MKTILALVLAVAGAGSAVAQTSVSIGINQPGVYGRVQIGDVPRPALWHPEPVIVAPPRVVVHQQPVYFVRDEWVRERYEHEHPGWNRGRHRGWDKHDGRGRDDDRGHGRGHDRRDKH